MSRQSLFRFSSGLLTVALASSLLAFQRGGLRGADEDDTPYPLEAGEKTEWAFARLHYNGYYGGNGCFRGGASRWLVDAPAADRHFAQGVRRLTRISTKSVEQFVDPSSDDLLNWPWIYAV